MDILHKDKYDLMENEIKNIDSIAAYNPTSLNTMRILTIHSSNAFNILMACLRIGAKGNKVDNISCGGSSSLIDLNTGCLCTPFVANAYRKIPTTQEGWVENPLMGKDRKIPYWDETIDMIKKAAMKVPEIHVVGWDVAITVDGPILIEGNESCDTAVMQYYFEPQEPGLKKRFLELVSKI